MNTERFYKKFEFNIPVEIKNGIKYKRERTWVWVWG